MAYADASEANWAKSEQAEPSSAKPTADQLDQRDPSLAKPEAYEFELPEGITGQEQLKSTVVGGHAIGGAPGAAAAAQAAAQAVRGQRASPRSADGVDDAARKVRVNVNFSREAYEDLDKLARDQGKTISETLRDAVGFARWYEEVRRAGGHLLVERNGKLREIVKI